MAADLSSSLVEAALTKGADEAEVYVQRTRTLGIEVKGQKIDFLESSVSLGYCVRIIKNNRLGFSYSTDPEELPAVAERALEASRFSAPDEYLGLPLPAVPPRVDLFDDQIASLTEKEAIDHVLLLERSALDRDTRITKLRKAAGNFAVNDTSIANSRGINVMYSSTACSAYVTAIAEDGNESQMGWDFEGNRFLRNVSFEQVGVGASEKALMLLGARKISPAKGFVLLDSSVASEFLGLLLSALSANAVQKKKSMLAGKIGETVISPTVNVVDNGLISGLLGSKPVDDEGVPVQNKTVVERGVLKGFLHNTYTARKDGMSSTGNATRGGFTGLPSIGPTNFFIEPVSKQHVAQLQNLAKMVDKGLYVIETMGMHTANPVSGEFSVGVSGAWIEKGEMKHPVKEAVISGTILDLLSSIVMVGDDLRFYGKIGTPGLLTEGIDISG